MSGGLRVVGYHRDEDYGPCKVTSWFCKRENGTDHSECCRSMLRNRDPYVYEMCVEVDCIDVFNKAVAAKIPCHPESGFYNVIRTAIRENRSYAAHMLVDCGIVSIETVMTVALEMFSPRRFVPMSASAARDPKNWVPIETVNTAFDVFLEEFSFDFENEDPEFRKKIAESAVWSGNIHIIRALENLGFPVFSKNSLVLTSYFWNDDEAEADRFIWTLGHTEDRVTPWRLLRELNESETRSILSDCVNKGNIERFKDIFGAFSGTNVFMTAIAASLRRLKFEFLEFMLESGDDFGDAFVAQLHCVSAFCDLGEEKSQEELDAESDVLVRQVTEFLIDKDVLVESKNLLCIIESKRFITIADVLFENYDEAELGKKIQDLALEFSGNYPARNPFKYKTFDRPMIRGRFDAAFFDKYHPGATLRPWIRYFITHDA